LKKRLGGFLKKLGEINVGLLMIVLSLGIFFADFSFLDALSLRIYDLNFKSRGTLETKKDIVIIAIDQKSQEKLGRWPWSRNVMVELVNRLSEFHPKVVGLDIVFSYPEERPDLELSRRLLKVMRERRITDLEIVKQLEEAERFANVDTRLAAAFRKAGNVVPGYFFFTTAEEVGPLNLDSKADYKIIRRSRYKRIKYPKSGPKDYILKEALGVKPNIKKLTRAAVLTGYFNIFPDSDGITRRFVDVVKFRNKLFPPAVIQMLAVYYGDLKPKIEFEEFGVSGIHVGTRTIPVDEFGRSLINYYGPEGEFKRISVSDVLDGSISDEELEKALDGRLVIVGATAMGIYDIRHTPFGSMAGPEVEATYMQNVIDGIVPSKAGWFFIFNFLSILFMGVVLILTMKRVKIFGGAVVAAFLIVLYILFQRVMFTQYLIQLDVLYPILSIILVYAGLAFFKFFVEASERKYIQGAFGHYLSPAVINQILKDPSQLQLGGIRKEMTVLFSDIAGFSSVSETIEPEELVQLLNVYLTEMSDIIMGQDGTVDKYEGDAIIAFFGAPLDDPKHPYHCVLAALNMQKKLAEMREGWKKEGKPLLRMRIGLNTGNMVVGNMGSKSRMDYTIMGDSVNLGARIEGANKAYGTETMVTHYTYNLCRDFFDFRELDTIRVVGKQEAITVYELLGVKGEISADKGKILETYNMGLSHYKAREWDKAIDSFGEVLNYDETDGPSLTYLERCLDFQVRPPDVNWDGVYILTSK